MCANKGLTKTWIYPSVSSLSWCFKKQAHSNKKEEGMTQFVIKDAYSNW